MSENKDIQGKSTQITGLKKSVHKTILKDGEYHHLKNGVVSSFEGDIPFIQNAPSNIECVTLPLDYKVIGSKFIKEKDYHILFLANSISKKSEIGIFNGKECKYSTIVNQNCLNFNTKYPIKCVYKIKNCELHIYFEDNLNKDRHINLDDLPYIKKEINGCLINTEIFDCDIINIQNNLTPPVVKPSSPIESGALFSGVYQFAICYSNINGDEQSSYYSKTNPMPIYEDSFLNFKNIEGSQPNKITNKAIPLTFSNLDIKYDYFNLAVIKTIQGTPTYELVVTLPISTKKYLYTGREITKLLSIDKVVGLYPDYYNSKTITNANNYLIRANMSTQDEANYQPLANLIELNWAVIRKKADTFETSYKNPINSVEIKGYQRGEVYPFGIQFLLSNGRKTSVFHIPGRKPKPTELLIYTKDNIPPDQLCNFYEFTSEKECDSQEVNELYHWQVYDTSSITEEFSPDELTKCGGEVIARGEFAYWESTDSYPCNIDVYQDLAGQKIRHHKFPTNNTIYHHNKPYDGNPSSTISNNFEVDNLYIYPIGIELKKSMDSYLFTAVNRGILTKEEADLIIGYEIVRGDRTNNKSIIAKGLMYNMRYYTDVDPSGNKLNNVLYPNYPFNDLREDKYLRDDVTGNNTTEYYEIDNIQPVGYLTGFNISTGIWNNPYPVTFVLDRDIPGSIETFTVLFSKIGVGLYTNYQMTVRFYEGDALEDFAITIGTPFWETPTYSNNYKKDFFTFHSPDTSFKKPFLGQELNLHAVEYGVSKGRFYSVEGHPKFKSSNRSDSANYALSFKAIGDYNNYSPISINNWRRKLKDISYLIGNNFTKLPNTDDKINNRFRESSVGFKLNCDLDDPIIIDESRYTISQEGLCKCKEYITDRNRDNKDSFEVDSICTESYKYISSYYGSLKQNIPNQYGQIDTIKYVLTGSYFNIEHPRPLIFGGDTFITRFSLRRKNSFFSLNFINQSPIGVSYKNSIYHNLLTPVYIASNEKGGALGGEFNIDWKTSKLDCTVDTGGILSNTRNRNGYFYLFSNGIANFFVESDINTELRYSLNNIWDTWYPKLKNTNEWDFMEEIKSPIDYDNSYYYNFDYSKQNTEEALFPQIPDFNPNNQCKNTHPRRIVYSKQDNEESSADNWLVTLGNNYYDVDSYLGSILDVEAIDTFKVLVRCENGSLVFNAYDTLQLDQSTITVGTGGMFSQRPQTFAETDTGYGGSQSKWAIDVTQFGTFYTEFKRGRIYNFTSQLDEISTNGMFDWFQENMSFKILQKIPNVNLDNPYTGIGYTSTFDNRLNIWFLTKKDYILNNNSELGNITLDENKNILYKGYPADFANKKLWKNVGWTISYSPIYKAWISFHSFLPNYYIEDINKFFTGIQDGVIYKHWDKFTFQTYYKKLYPFEYMITTANEQQTSILQSVEYNLKVQKYLNSNYQDLYENHKINFNKAIISTDNQSSGLLNLIRKDNSNPFHSLKYPIKNADSVDVLYSKIEGHKYRINQFADLVLDKNNNVPIFLHDENGVDRYVNNVDYNKIKNLTKKNQKFRNEFFDITFINDKESDYKFIIKSHLNKTLKSIR
jgi:hypothetical protein